MTPIIPGKRYFSSIKCSCLPYRNHYYPVGRYNSSGLEYENGGLTAFAYLSVIGSGKNYQLNTASNQVLLQDRFNRIHCVL